jgi:DNA replication protein
MNQHVFLKWAQQKHLSIPSLLLEHYTDLQLDEYEFVAILHIQSFLDGGDAFPTPQLLSERMSINLDECAKLIGALVKKKLLAIENRLDDTGVFYENYTLEPLWAALIRLLEQKGRDVQTKTQKKQEGELYQQFEQEFARPLSPIEAETLSMWLDEDKHSAELISAALREAVVSGKLNFRYIDRILFEWKRNSIKTVEDAKAHSERFRKKSAPKPRKETANTQDIPGFHWLENL